MQNFTRKILVIILVVLVILSLYLIITNTGIAGETSQQDQTNNEASSTDEGADPEEDVKSEELLLRRAAILEEAMFMFRGYFYEEALELLNADELLINDKTRELEARIIEERESLELFEGQVKHIFFHSLMLYPEYLFPDLSIPTGGLNEGFVFQSEFQKMLPQLLERGYVLYNINDVFGVGGDGQMEQREIWLPPGKRPLILSIDDPTYHYGVGLANRLLVDANGELRTEVITPEGETIITNDGDIQLILNDFVKEHPEFSWRGHKGIIAATGFMGIFGYDLQSEESRIEATKVAEALTETGWIFASHSYTHNHGISGWWAADANVYNIRQDIALWREKIEPIIGQTNILIAPGGVILPPHAMEVILENGFNIYCSVEFNQSITMFPDHVIQGRIEIGGFALTHWADYLTEYFFDVEYVLESHRPPILSQ